MSQAGPSQLPERVSALEQGQEQILTELHRLNRSIERLGVSNKTQWGPLVSAAAVMLALVGMFGSALTEKIARVDSTLEQVAVEARKHASKLGHPENMVNQISGLSRDVDRTNNRLESSLEKLDESMQREMETGDDQIRVSLRWIEKELDRLTAEFTESQLPEDP